MLTIDRYTKAVLTVIALAVSILALRVLPSVPVAESQAKGEVPKAYGKAVGFDEGVWFEASDGTLRHFKLPESKVAVEITRK